MKPSKSSISILIAVLSFGTIFVASVFTTRSTVVARVRVGEPVGSIKPIKGVDVIVQKKPGNTAVRSLQTDAEGSFTVDTLPPGSYQLWLKCKECQSIAIDESGVHLTLIGTKENPFERKITKQQLVDGVKFPFEIVGRGTESRALKGIVSLLK